MAFLALAVTMFSCASTQLTFSYGPGQTSAAIVRETNDSFKTQTRAHALDGKARDATVTETSEGFGRDPFSYGAYTYTGDVTGESRVEASDVRADVAGAAHRANASSEHPDVTGEPRVIALDERTSVADISTEGSTTATPFPYVDRAKCAKGLQSITLSAKSVMYIANIRKVASAADSKTDACTFNVMVPRRHVTIVVVESLGERSPCGYFAVYKRRRTPLLPQTYDLFTCTPPVHIIWPRSYMQTSLHFDYFFPPSPQLEPQHELSFSFKLIFNVQDVRKHPLTMGNVSKTMKYVLLTTAHNRKPVTFFREAHIPDGDVAMVSVVNLSFGCRRKMSITLSLLEVNGTRTDLWSKRCTRAVPAMVLKGKKIRFTLFSESYIYYGFTAFVSFHPESSALSRQSEGLFNCSVAHYADFSQHLDCNLEKECQGNEDETSDCAFSSPACPGMIASRHKCYFYPDDRKDVSGDGESYMMSWNQALDLCRLKGGALASPRTKEELRDLLKLPYIGKRFATYLSLGLTWGKLQFPFMYRKMFQWTDRTVVYHLDFIHVHPFRKAKVPFCGIYRTAVNFVAWVRLHNCSYTVREDAICEVETTRHEQFTALAFADMEVDRSEMDEAKYTKCPAGHVTHNFLRCDIKSECGQERYAKTCPFPANVPADTSGVFAEASPSAPAVAMFQCEDSGATVPYSLVCDFHLDCLGGSDEWWCTHPPCSEWTCENGQCLSFNESYDEIPDCADESDLTLNKSTDPIAIMTHSVPSAKFTCVSYGICVLTILPVAPPVIINFDGKGLYSMKTLAANASCPVTHYLCTSEPAYCLPVYTRCNGIHDCLDRRDEKGCQDVACPGFYRCRASSVCAHVRHLCDGWPQCPQRDDELLCDVKCPSGCLCQGHAFLCWWPISAHHFPQLRYLDARNSGMTPSNVSRNAYLVVLKISNCSARYLPQLTLPNLQLLDLSENLLVQVEMTVFLGTPSLKILSLAGNPLVSLTSADAGNPQQFLITFDVSRTQLRTFGSGVLSLFPNVERLNLSSTPLRSISDEGFSRTPGLTELDMSGSEVRTFPTAVFHGLHRLQLLASTNFRLCCPDILPRQDVPTTCEAPQHPLSSCERLLGYKSFQVVMWLVATLATAGNVACVLVRRTVYKDVAEGRLGVLVTNLNAANLVMGLYAVLVVAADEQYGGQYRRHEQTWKSGSVCKLAGFLATLSSEVSSLIVCLITLDHVVSIKAPRCSKRLGKRSAVLGCLVAWLLGATLAAAPPLAFAPRWQVHALSGLCVAQPFSHKDFVGRDFFLGIGVVFRLLQALPILAGHVVIARAVHKDMYIIDPSKKSLQVIAARRTTSVVATDAVACFSTALFSLIQTAGDVPAEYISIIFAVFVLPINSVLNPFLYLMKQTMETRRKERESRLISMLKTRASSAATSKQKSTK